MAFTFPIIKNCLSYFTICATNSLNSENGGFVTTASACLSNSTHSALLKSPLPLK